MSQNGGTNAAGYNSAGYRVTTRRRPLAVDPLIGTQTTLDI
jgi:hypothetical protein